ncbi:MAG: T9SS type A sorting domain-containing protein, partial [Flavobacteriales bacterium]|nr:T9SS type A sorting domain-containing protein [Flavobacteriales bacterium]
HALLTLVDNGDDAQYSAGSLDYALYSGSCAGMGATASVACVADASGLNVLNVTPNTEYTLLVYNTGSVGDAGTFGIMLEHPAHHDAAITGILNLAPGQLCGSTMTPQVTLANYGDLNLTAVEIVYGLSGGASHTYNWSGNLAYGQSVNVTLPTVPAEPGNGQTFTASVNLPNGQPDEITANDASNVAGLDVGGEGVRVVIHTDNNGAATTWAIYTDDFGVYVEGGPYSGQDNTTIDEFHCLPVTSGHLFRFTLMDSDGDGLCCANGNGYWELRKPDGGLLLRDLFDASVNGSTSPSSTQANPGYGYGHSFYLPAGPVNIHPDECGIFNNRADNKVFAVKQAGTNYLGQTLSYQFEFSNPDAGYIRRIKKPRNYVLFSELNPSPLTAGVAYFARVRTDKTGPITEAHWGTGCEMGLGATVNCTQLIEAPDYGHSCNEVRRYGPSSFIYAQPVFGATQYSFRVYIPGETFDYEFVRNTYILELFGFPEALQDQSTYHVQVKAKVNDTWGNYCGDCTISIDNQQQMPGQHLVQGAGEATLWPNPVRDGQVNLNIEGITAAVQHITVDIKDLYGQHVYGKEFGNSGERFSTVLNLPGDIASGVYLVNITINGDVTTKRLTIVR